MDTSKKTVMAITEVLKSSVFSKSSSDDCSIFNKNQKVSLSRTTRGSITNIDLEIWDSTFEELSNVLHQRDIGTKDGTYFLRTTGLKRKDSELSDTADFFIIDGDSRISDNGELLDGCVDSYEVHKALKVHGIPHIIYSSHSAFSTRDELEAKDNELSDRGGTPKPRGGAEGDYYFKWRLLVPCCHHRQQLNALIDFTIGLLHAENVMVADVLENHTWSQAWFLPRVKSNDLIFGFEMACFSLLEGYVLDADLIYAAWLRQQPVSAPSNNNISYKKTDGLSPIDSFNSEYSVREVIERVGYIQKDHNRYLHPTSSSGVAGLVIFSDEAGKEFAYSHAGDILNDGKRHDAFDCYRLLECNGDWSTALKWNKPPDEPDEFDTDNSVTAAINFPAKNAKGRPMQIAENLQAVLTARNITVRYNQISKRVELIMPGVFSIIDEQDNATLTLLTDEAVKAGMTAARIDEFCTAIAARNPFCPVRAFIESVEWDGHSRFEQFFKQIDTPTPEIAKSLIKKWLVQAVAAVYESNGLSAAGVLVLMGSQGVGKTRLLRSLAKGVDDYFLEGALLSPDDKDSVMTVCSRWIVELGEVDATFRKSDIAQLKAFITKSVDVLRKPYARKDSFLPRRTVFAASVNEFQFLQDSTGNRRFWPTEVTGVTLDADLNIQQLWAEMKTHYDAGVTWHMSAVELWELNSRC